MPGLRASPSHLSLRRRPKARRTEDGFPLPLIEDGIPSIVCDMSSTPPPAPAGLPSGGSPGPSAPAVPGFATLWAQLWDWANIHPSGSWFFRGQGGPWPILPKIGRPTYHYNASRERAMLGAFKSAARPMVAVQPRTDWEWLALAQHHGMPTRLVDWSTNVLVACWFAVTSGDSGDASIFALEAGRADVGTCDTETGKTSLGTTAVDPLELKASVFLVESSPVSPRITSQRGIFTAHGSPTTPLAIPAADQFTVPDALRGDMQAQLLDIGIDASHIYPGIDGLCQTLDWRFRSGKGFSALV